MRDRRMIENHLDNAHITDSDYHRKLFMEVLLDIRELLKKIDTKIAEQTRIVLKIGK